MKTKRYQDKPSHQTSNKDTTKQAAHHDLNDDKTNCDEESKQTEISKHIKHTEPIEPIHQSPPPSPLTQPHAKSSDEVKADADPVTPKKESKVIKCWADYDSDSDLDFETESINDGVAEQNEYEKYIKEDLEKSESCNALQIQQTETETEAADDEKEIEVTPQKQEEEKEEERKPLNEVYQNKQQKWRKKKDENSSEKENKKQEKAITIATQTTRMKGKQEGLDVWFPHCEPITLKDIMNDQSRSKENVKPSTPNGSSGSLTRVAAHNFAVPFNKMVKANHVHYPKKKTKQFLYIDTPTYPSYNNKKIEKLIHKLSSSKRNNYHNISRNELSKKSQLKQQKAEKRRLQLRQQRSNKWQIVAAKKKQKREHLRKQTEKKILLQKQELNKKLNSAKMRYENTMKEKKMKAKQYDIKIKNAKKIKDNELSQKREIQRASQEERMKNAVKRYKQTISKKKQNAKPKTIDKEKKKNNKKKNKASKVKQEMEVTAAIVDAEGMKQILTVLLASSAEYMDGMKAKKEWMKHCHFAELKSCVQSLCSKINRFMASKRVDSLSFLMSINDDSSKNKPQKDQRDNGLESQLQNILKLMDNKQTEDASTTYLLMYLMDNLIELTPCFDYLSVRTQRLLLQCIANSTQKNRGVSHYIIRSKSCLFLMYLLMKILFVAGNGYAQSSSEVDSIVHSLTLSLNSIREYPDLLQRKKVFYKYVSVLGFFNRIVSLFALKNNNKKEAKYDLFLRIIPFIQSVTAGFCDTDDAVICNVVYDTNCYGLHSLISSLVLDDENNYKKKKPTHILRIILYSFQSINNMAQMNISSFQEYIVDRMHLMELYHVLSHLLQHLSFHYSNSNQIYTYIIRILLAQLLLFIGYCAVQNERFQECLRWGAPNLINQLCQLPFDYFNKASDKEVLLPTLIAATFENDANCKILKTRLSCKHLTRFILKVYHKKYQIKKRNSKDNKQIMTSTVYHLSKRFPLQVWPNAIKFYRQQ
eukprot:217214_1